MAFIGPGAIWDMETGTFIATNVPGVQADYDAAKAAISAGVFYVGPGLEGLVLGTFGPNQVLMLITATGIVGYSRFHVLDGTDPTKRLRFDASGIGAGVTRVATIRDWSGVMLMPADDGVLNQFLKSNGPGVQPSWAAGGGINALLDGLNHTDTVAQAVLRGALVIGNATPAWARLPIGAASQLLKSDGVDPSWGTVALLSAFHSDTLGAAPVRGDLIVANATPAWARFAKGAADTILGSDGTDLQWRNAAYLAALVGAALEHNALLHLKPFQVANCEWLTTSDVVTTTGGGFANVKVGDFLFLGAATHFGVQGAYVIAWTDSNTIQVSHTNSGTTVSATPIIFQPGDHWDPTIALDAGAGGGYLMSLGSGTYGVGSPGGDFTEWRGPVRWRGHTNGSTQTDFRVQGSTSLGTPFGFRIEKGTTGIFATFFVNDLSAGRNYRLPDIGDGTIIVNTGVQSMASKTIGAACKILVDGTAAYTVFQTSAEVDRLAFDLSAMSALRAVAYKDYAGNAVVASNEGAAGEVLTSNGAGVAPSYQAAGAGSPPAFVSLAKWGTD